MSDKIDFSGEGVWMVVQARMGSRRLPKKIALPFAGMTILTFLLQRIRSFSCGLAVATSVSSDDDATETLAKSCGVRVFRGSIDDVFSRFQKAARESGAEHLVRLTADNPLIDLDLIRHCVASHLICGADLTSTREILPDRSVLRFSPKGQSVDILKATALLSVNGDTLDDFEKEHVIPFFFRERRTFRLNIVKNAVTKSPAVSVDTEEDYRELLKWEGKPI